MRRHYLQTIQLLVIDMIRALSYMLNVIDYQMYCFHDNDNVWVNQTG